MSWNSFLNEIAYLDKQNKNVHLDHVAIQNNHKNKFDDKNKCCSQLQAYKYKVLVG